MSRVLLVEDDELLGETVRLNLVAAGYEVYWATDGDEAARLLDREAFDALLLDIALPGRDGLTLLRSLRERGDATPALMLTVKAETRTKVEAFADGADDYLTKPFDVEELLARVAALIRRARAARQIPAHRLVRIGACEVNLETRQVRTPRGRETLSEKEAALLELLIRADGEVLSRNDILDEVWGMDAFPTARTVDNFLLRLRKLLEEDPRNPRHIVTVRGRGYRLVRGPESR